jgi:hypothetical protein
MDSCFLIFWLIQDLITDKLIDILNIRIMIRDKLINISNIRIMIRDKQINISNIRIMIRDKHILFFPRNNFSLINKSLEEYNKVY